MASKADKAARPGASSSSAEAAPAAAAPSAAAASALQTSVLLVQVEALGEDDAIRQELKRHGFRVTRQALVHLAKDDARHFVLHVCDPASADRVGPVDAAEGDPGDASASPRDNTLASPRAAPAAAAAGSDASLSTDRLGAESVADAIHALASGPVLMLAVEKPNAVADLLELVGPATPELWSSAAPSCLRARFGKSSEALGVRCSLQASTVALEIAFLLACSGPPSSSSSSSSSLSSGSGRAHKSRKSADVDLEQLLAFLFPRHVQHPNSAGRLFVFGLYGPLDAHARLRSGEKGLHVVTDLELAALSARMEREDILRVYRMCSLSQQQEDEVLRHVDQLLKSFPQYTPRDIRALFHALPATGTNGVLSFHDMQAAIVKERCRRVLCMKEQLHPALAAPIRNQFRRALSQLPAAADVSGSPASFFLRDVGVTGAENATLVARLLSARAFEICHLDDANAPALTQNVRLLRASAASDAHAEPWDPNCQHRRRK